MGRPPKPKKVQLANAQPVLVKGLGKVEKERKTAKELSSAFSTGGGGAHFEAHVQASFVALMLTGGFAPCLPLWPINKIKLQGKFVGFETDDLIVFVNNEEGIEDRKLLGQIKHSVSITENDATFGEVIQAAWNDFNNEKIFARSRDAIALITGPLSATDIHDVRPILERARHSENAVEFFTSIELGRFTSDGSRNKLKAFRSNLKKANKDKDVSDEETYAFLRHFHLLGYDLDIKAGVTLSLLHSIIGLHAQASAKALWLMLVDEVQSANKNAGTLTKGSLSEDLRLAFTKQVLQSIPPDYTVTTLTPSAPALAAVPYSPDLKVANLLGAWDEKNNADCTVIETLAIGEFSTWIHKVGESLHQPDPPISVTNGKWRVVERLPLWEALGPRLLDEDLANFKQCAVSILMECDPKFDLPSEQRYAAGIHGKSLKYSSNIRKGVAETLAILGSHPKPLTHCSMGNAEVTAAHAVREILSESDWVRWASLNELLPLLAEAAPSEFLSAVEEALASNPCPFDKVFAQEGIGIFGGNYMSGVQWALETLAWSEDYFGRAVLCLGELASRDPGGQFANRPANSLTTILLPWLPQTRTSIVRRVSAVSSLLKELPDIGWKLLLSLLPQAHSMSSGTHKPIWRDPIPEDFPKGVTKSDFREQIELFSVMAITAAMSNEVRLTTLIDHIENLPPNAREHLLSHLGSEAVVGMPEEIRLGIWNELVELVIKHKKFSETAWAMKPELVDRISVIADKLAPSSPGLRYRRLFNGRDFDHYEETGNYEEQRIKLDNRRQIALDAVAENSGLEGILAFATQVQSSWEVGITFGAMAGNEIDKIVMPDLLLSDQKQLARFAEGFVRRKYDIGGWAWVDQIGISAWTSAQIGQFLSYLPFAQDTWDCVNRILGKEQGDYWTKTSANPHEAGNHLETAIDQLLQYGRPNAALRCLHKILHDNQPYDPGQVVRSLLATINSPENSDSIDAYMTVEMIKALQENPITNTDDLIQVEWAFLSLLDHYNDSSPITLWRQLALRPEFFCEVIRIAFRSNKEEASANEPSEDQKRIATNAYHLLQSWRVPPGLREDDTFDREALTGWLTAVRLICENSGHLGIAMSILGHSFVHVPSDPDGLWIHRSVAEVLNAKDAQDMRDGFQSELFNSRGVHGYTAGQEERDLSIMYRTRSDALEEAGYQRLATTVRELAKSYERDADRESAQSPFDES